MKLNEYIRARRVAAGLSRRKLARTLGVSQTTLLHIERGRSVPRIETLIALGESLGYRVAVVERDRSLVLRTSKGSVLLAEGRSRAELESRFAELLTRLSPEHVELAVKILKVFADEAQ